MARNRLLEFRNRLWLQQRPTVTGAENRAVAQLHHARVLRAAEWICVNQLQLAAPAFSIVTGPHEDEIAVWVCVARAWLAEGAAFGRPPKCDEKFSARPQHDGWEGGVEICVLVNDDVFDFADAAV